MKVVYLKDHGNSKAGTEVEMPESTAKALIAHKVVEEAGKKKAK